MNELSYCGFNCINCPYYKDSKCYGCKSSSCHQICSTCNIKQCNLNKHINSCGECNEYPCKYIKKNLSKESLDNLDKIFKERK